VVEIVEALIQSGFAAPRWLAPGELTIAFDDRTGTPEVRAEQAKAAKLARAKLVAKCDVTDGKRVSARAKGCFDDVDQAITVSATLTIDRKSGRASTVELGHLPDPLANCLRDHFQAPPCRPAKPGLEKQHADCVRAALVKPMLPITARRAKCALTWTPG
jgi:hypothetical protein